MPKRIFVPGGTGYIGRKLIPELVRRGHDVTTWYGPVRREKSPVRAGLYPLARGQVQRSLIAVAPALIRIGRHLATRKADVSVCYGVSPYQEGVDMLRIFCSFLLPALLFVP